MQSLEICPSPPLRRYVQLIWCLELDATETIASPERIAPDGIMELVLHYRAPLALRFGSEPFAVQPRTSVISQTRRFVEIAPRSATGFISVRFWPWGGYHFLAQPLAVVADRCTPAVDLWGRDVAALEERLALAAKTGDRIREVEAFLLRRLARHQKSDVERLLRALWHSAATLPIGKFCREAGLTERTLQRRCVSAVGMAPRSYRRLARFLQSCALLRRGGWQSLTEVAYQSGYFDQAHFTSDFKELSGLTPRQFLGAKAFSFLDLD